MVEISRAALFEKAWAQPLTTVAAEFGVTSTALKKTCDRHAIPTPSRGYWAAVASGKTFPRPKLRPVKDARLETVRINGAPPLPSVVAEAMREMRESLPAAPAPPRAARQTRPAPPPLDRPETSPQPPTLDRPELNATRKALSRAKPNRDGFLTVRGAGVVPCIVGVDAAEATLRFLLVLLEAGAARGWTLERAETRARLRVDGETLDIQVLDKPQKVPHEPSSKELVEKARRLRAGDERDPWPQSDPRPSGRLSLLIEENNWSGLRRSFLAPKGKPLADLLDAILVGLAGHAAYKAEERREAEEQARIRAEEEARRARREAFEKREARRSAFVEQIAATLEARARLQAVAAHLATSDPSERDRLAKLEAWIARRLRALEAMLDPVQLDISARHSEVSFGEPPPVGAERYYWRGPELHLWLIDEEKNQARSVGELEWAVAEGLIADPAAPPPPANDMARGGAGEGADEGDQPGD